MAVVAAEVPLAGGVVGAVVDAGHAVGVDHNPVIAGAGIRLHTTATGVDHGGDIPSLCTVRTDAVGQLSVTALHMVAWDNIIGTSGPGSSWYPFMQLTGKPRR